jgi:hypothetical protein
VEALAREVRRIDAGSLECGGLASDERSARRLEFACTPEVVALWGAASSAAQQVAGRMLRASERAELIAAEVASALPVDAELETLGAATPELWTPLSITGAHAPGAERAPLSLLSSLDSHGDLAARWVEDSCAGRAELASLANRPDSTLLARTHPPLASPWLAESAKACSALVPPTSAAPSNYSDDFSDSPGGAIPPPPIVDAWLSGIECADAFELERRLILAFAFEQRWAAELGPRLERVLRRGVQLALGYRQREAYQRERLGLDPSWCRALLRIERAACLSPAFAHAWRAGELSFSQAAALVPLLHAELPEASVVAWVRRAQEYSLRRLRDDVETTLVRRECAPEAWLPCGGLLELDDAGRADTDSESVAQAEDDREIGAKSRGADRNLPSAQDATSTSEIAARSIAASAGPAREACRVSMIVETEVAQLFRALHCSVRRRLERDVGRAVTPGEALGWICAHALRSWNAVDARTRREHRVFTRDGWRCVVPACTRMRALHAHHVVYRAQGGGNEGDNLVTLCAYHHLRGVHGGRLRIRGRAPHALRFELGLRGGHAPLAVHASGDRRLAVAGG